MPRDTTEVPETISAATATLDMVPACYLCGAWADDARRCRHPGSTACIQTGARFAITAATGPLQSRPSFAFN